MLTGGEIAVYQFGMIPARLFGTATLDPALAEVPAWATVLTSMFMHGGWMHLGFNMLFLWIFGDNIEDSMGHARYLVFYLLCGVAAALAQAFVNPGSTIPMVGSGPSRCRPTRDWRRRCARPNVTVLAG